MDAPLGRVDIEIRCDDFAVVANGINAPLHGVDEEAAGARLIDKEHQAGRIVAGERDGGEFSEVDEDHAVAGGDGFRKRVFGGFAGCGGGCHQESCKRAGRDTHAAGSLYGAKREEHEIFIQIG